VAGTTDSNVAPEAASTHSPPIEFLNVFTAVAMAPSLDAR
jgi:hypothetical protein